MGLHDMGMPVTVIGGGLAGCEAGWQLAERGFLVRPYEMRPGKMTGAHVSDRLAELAIRWDPSCQIVLPVFYKLNSGCYSVR
jgi:heterodisulfide reductase subunit A-like polyferredoxin